MALRDVARVFDVPIQDVNEFAKVIYDYDEGSGLIQAHKNTQEGQKFSTKYPDIVNYASRLEGTIRGTSQHAAGLVISAEDLREGSRGYLALRSGQEVINWDKDDDDFLGLMKLDILGLNTLTVLNETKKLIKINYNKDINFRSLELNDHKIFQMLSRGETIGIFQFSTWPMTKLAKEVKVDNFSSMKDLLALVRPGVADSGMADNYIK